MLATLSPWSRMMARQAPSAVLLCLISGFVNQESTGLNGTYSALVVPCKQFTNIRTFPNETESYMKIYAEPYNRKLNIRHCSLRLQIPSGKFISLRIFPFEPTSSCREISIQLSIHATIKIHPCDRHTTYHSRRSHIVIYLWYGEMGPAFSITIAVRALEQNGHNHLHVTHHTRLSGTVTPYLFDGFTDYAQFLETFAVLKPPPEHSLMLSFPHFNLKTTSGCLSSRLELSHGKHTKGMWRQCGNLQLFPKVFKNQKNFWFNFVSEDERGYTGFKLRFSFHNVIELPQKVLTGNAPTTIFNCSVPFYDTFSQHLACNLEMECANLEDEAKCPYWHGDCQSDLLNAGGKCYKYIRTRKTMTWYDASSVCLKQGMTLASFTTFMQGEAFRNGILRYAPTTFNTFVGLRTSDTSLPAIYREVWQWSNGIIAYYIDIDRQQLFKPTCGSFAAMFREKISTTLCGFYEYMHYIFCEAKTTEVLTKSRTVRLINADASSTFTVVNSTHFIMCPEEHIVHAFLSCDHESWCSAEPGLKSCATYSPTDSNGAMSRANVLMYVCDSQTQTIHYTQVCDHQAQCFDSSDESFCIYQVCPEKQCLNKQCVASAQWCDGMAHCSDGSDEACPQFMRNSAKPQSDLRAGFHAIQFDGYGKYKYIPQGKEFPDCPPTHFMCANRKLCLPVYLRCNGVYDCATKEDEDNCESARCPDFYRCRQSVVCVHPDHLCDGVFQCPQQDDELLCQLVCPYKCLCQGVAFVCSRPFPVQDYADLRYLDSSGSGLVPDQHFHNRYLVRLSLAWCSLYKLPMFSLPNLKFLYLDHNNLINVNMNAFLKLTNLKILSLSGNPVIKLVNPRSNSLLENVHSLDLSFTRLQYFEDAMLWNIRNLKRLNISYGMLKVIGDTGFRSLTQLESLDLRGSELKEYPVRMLQSLAFLRILFSDVYKLCCREILPEQFNIQNCHTPQNIIVSCKDLLRSDIYRTFLWISCCFALFGNAGSFAAKLYMQRKKPQTSFGIFISHLNVADFLMGLYLIVTGSADQVYRGTYVLHDKQWKHSACCKTAGFFSLLSCEMSAFIICLITLDRFLAIHLPFRQVSFNKVSAHVICGLSWVAGIALAALPLLPMTSLREFYSQTDICIPLPVTNRDFKGRFYSFGILIVFNFLLFVLIAVGQILIYISIHAHSMETVKKIERETTVARRLLTVVMTDFLCWFPIGLFGLLASSGVSIPGEVNVAVAIFALPVNSALNPFLYTFNLIKEKRRKAAEERLLKILLVKYGIQYGRVSVEESKGTRQRVTTDCSTRLA